MRLAVVATLGLWAGSVLVLSELRWFRRPSITTRLRLYVPGGFGDTRADGGLSVASFRELVAPLARAVGERLAAAFGVDEDLASRLERLHSDVDVTDFRVRQVGRMALAMVGGVVVTMAATPPVAVSVFLVIGPPLLTFLLIEQSVATASAARQRRLFLELPVVAEQLAMLLSAGYSLGAALHRLSQRSHGACAEDLAIVIARTRQGLDEVEALREWAARARVPALDRLVPVLALNREASDLGRLLSEEARSIRREVQRELIETMDRRGQAVWIPVTVATLVPGVIFLAVPFIEALRLFSQS